MVKPFRLIVREVPCSEMDDRLYFIAGGLMQRAVSPAPWNYSQWPVGSPDSPPGTETATGYLKLCDTFVFLELESLGGGRLPVGICAGMGLTPSLIDTVHLHEGIDDSAAREQLRGKRSEPIPELDFYHLIIAIEDIVRPDGLPLRGSILGGQHAARIMLEMLITLAKRAGKGAFWSKTHPDVTKMHHLFEAHGLRKVGSHVMSHGASSAPRYIYVCDLEDQPELMPQASILGEWISTEVAIAV